MASYFKKMTSAADEVVRARSRPIHRHCHGQHRLRHRIALIAVASAAATFIVTTATTAAITTTTATITTFSVDMVGMSETSGGGQRNSRLPTSQKNKLEKVP